MPSRTAWPFSSRFAVRLGVWGAASAVALLFFTACASERYVWVDQMPAASFGTPSDVIIGPGDVISVRVFNQDAMSARGRVRNDGSFSVPLIGEVAVSGKHPTALGRELEDRLKPYVNAPHVLVTIEESFTKVTVIGEVRRPGPVSQESSSVVAALANAGGLTEFASQSRIFVLRRDNAGRIQRVRFRYDDIVRGSHAANAFRLRSGDVIVVE